MKTKIVRFIVNNWLMVLLAILPPLLLWYFLERESRSLSVRLESNVPIVTVDKNLADGIQILYQAKQVSSVDVMEVAIENTGNRSIERSDFDGPMRFVFSGAEITSPKLVRTEPNSITPTFTRDSLNSALLEPLLLNPDDRILFRTIVLNRISKEGLPLSVSARIRGVKQIEVQEAVTRKGPIYYLQIVVGFLGVLVSITSVLRLARGFRQITIKFPMKLAVDLTERIEADTETSQTVRRLADDLKISQHDYKANLLLLRIKIESLLREMARRLDLTPREQAGSISRLASMLRDRGAIPPDITMAIADISPVINREMHAVESYLTNDEYASLQNLALGVVAFLEKHIKDVSKQNHLRSS